MFYYPKPYFVLTFDFHFGSLVNKILNDYYRRIKKNSTG